MWPSGIVDGCVYLSGCVCLNYEFVSKIIYDPFKQVSANLDRKCKTPWLRLMLFCGMVDIQGQI